MADYTNLRNIFNINPRMSDDEIRQAFENAGFFERGAGFGNSRSSLGYMDALGPLEKQREYRILINEAIEEEIRLESELQELKERGASQDEIRQKQAELAEAKRETDYLKQKKHSEGLSASIRKIYDSVTSVVSAIQKMNDPWMRADDAAKKYGKTIGQVAAGVDALRKSTLKNMVNNHLGINYNISTERLLELQGNYSKAVGRNVRFSNEDQETLAAINLATDGIANELLPDFEKMGVFLTDSGDHIYDMFKSASKEGISLERYAKNVQQGLALAQTYNFKNGLKGMEEMARRAAAIRMDMSQIQSFANSFDTIEKSITNAAKLQVLGGQFAAAADPLGMLHDSLMGFEDTQKRMEQIIGNIGTYNRKTGEVYTSAFEKQRLKAYADATGQDFGKVMENVNRNVVVKEIRSQIRSSNNGMNLDEDMRKLIENSGEIKGGKAGVTIDGQFKTIDELSNDDREALIKETQDQSKDIKDIAKTLRSLKDIREGFANQKDAVQAVMTAPLAKLEGKLGKWIGTSNLLLGFILAAQGIGAISRYLPNRGGTNVTKFFKKRFGSSAAAVGRSASAIAPGGTIGTRAAFDTIADGTKIVTKNGQVLTKSGGSLVNSAGRKIGANANILKNAKLAEAEASAASKMGAIGRPASKIKDMKSAVTASKTARKTKQIVNLVKAGKGAKVASAGLKAAGKKIPIAGALLSAGFEAFENKEQFKDRQTRGKAIGQTAGAGVGAAIGAGLGSLIGPLGTVVGGVVGEKLGKFVGGVVGGTVTKIQNESRSNAKAAAERNIKDKDAARAVGRLKGDYSVKQMKEIESAVKGGGFNKKKLSNKAIRKLRESGDMEMLEALQDNKDAKTAEEKAKRKKEREERRAKRQESSEIKKNKFGVANFEIGTAHINGRNIVGRGLSTAGRIAKAAIGANPIVMAGKGIFRKAANLLPISIKGGKPEDGNSGSISVREKMRWRTEREGNENSRTNNGPIEVNINGRIMLESKNGQSVDIMAEIKKDPMLLRKLTQEIIKEMNVQKYGGYKSDRTFGNNIPGANA